RPPPGSGRSVPQGTGELLEVGVPALAGPNRLKPGLQRDDLMRILLTNDDGIYAPGLRAMRGELKRLGSVTVVAPATEQSAVGHSITLLTPLLVQEVQDDEDAFLGWAVEGRPADCVKLALLELLPEKPDLLVSGLNAGS